MYGKLVNGALILAPKVLMMNGEKVVFPSEEILESLGYMEVVYTEVPDMRDGYHVVNGWVEQNGKLVQKWNYESDEEWPTTDPYLMETLVQINEKLNALTYSLKKLSEGVTEVVKKEDSDMPLGDYLNPILITEAGVTTVEGSFYYTTEDNKLLPHEAVTEAFVTPEDFNDSNWFRWVD